MTAAIFGLLIISAIALAILYFEGIANTPKRLIFCAVLIALAMALRALNFDYRTGDYNTFLSRRVEYFRLNGGFRALSDSI